MDIMTKVRVLWEKVAGLETKEATTAATMADILPRIPADFSTNEVKTGVKWVDGKEIYMIVFNDSLPIIDSSYTHIISFTDWVYEDIIKIDNTVRSTPNNSQTNRYLVSVFKSAKTININSISSGYSEGNVSVIVYYTKPDPVPAQLDKGTGMITGEDPEPETKKRKTTKKEEK